MLKRFQKSFVFASWAVSVFTGTAFAALNPCSEAFTATADRAKRIACEKPWLVLIYMSADNNLSPYAWLDLYELQSMGSTRAVDIVVQLDLPGETGIDRLLIKKSPDPFDPARGADSFGNAKVSDLSMRLLKTLAEPTRLSEERRFRDFIVESAQNFPARQTLIITWGHGKGWTSLTRPTAKTREGGVGFSESSGRFLGIPALKRALTESAAIVRAGRPWDLFASDACLMQMAEVATELSPTAEILLGSSQNQDYLGIPYRALLRFLNGSRAPDARGVAMRLPELMRAFLEKSGAARGVKPSELDMGMSAIQTSEWRNIFLPAFRAFVARLKIEVMRDEALRIRLRSVSREALQFENGSVELGDYLRGVDSRLREASFAVDSPLRRELAGVIHSLDQAVLAYSVGTPELVTGKRSVSLWVPFFAADYSGRQADFAKSELHRTTELGALLKLLSR